jgi:hypothetical protein
MITPLLQVLFVFAASWALWSILKVFLGKNTLRYLPGPPSESLIFGEYLPRAFFSLTNSRTFQGISCNFLVLKGYHGTMR